MELRWVDSMRATKTAMQSCTSTYNDWWKHVRTHPRPVAFEVIAQECMPHADFDVKLAAGGDIFTARHLVRLQLAFCAMLRDAATDVLCKRYQSVVPVVHILAAPGTSPDSGARVSTHIIVRNVPRCSSMMDAKALFADPLSAAVQARAPQWADLVVGAGADEGLTLNKANIIAACVADNSIYQRMPWRKWRTPFANKEGEARPFLYYEPGTTEDQHHLMAAADFGEDATLPRELHVTTFGVYPIELTIQPSVDLTNQQPKKTQKRSQAQTAPTEPPKKAQKTPSADSTVDLLLIKNVCWEVAESAMGSDCREHFTADKHMTTTADSSPTHYAPFSIKFSRITKGPELPCAVCKRTHSGQSFSVFIWPESRRATVFCFGSCGKDVKEHARVCCSAKLGQWSAKLWPRSHPIVPPAIADLLDKMGKPILTLSHPWLQRANPMFLSSVLIPTEELDQNVVYNIFCLNSLVPKFMRLANSDAYSVDSPVPMFSSRDMFEMAMEPLLREWCRFNRLRGEVWVRTLVSRDGTWHSTWTCVKTQEARNRWPPVTFEYISTTPSKAKRKKTVREDGMDIDTATLFTFYANKRLMCNMEEAQIIPYNDISTQQRIQDCWLNVFDRLAIVREDVADIDLQEARARSAPYFFHLFHRVCRDYYPMYVYIRKYLAFLIQKCVVTRKMLVFISAQGAGKGIILNPITSIIGKWNVYNAHSSDGFERFNYHLMGKILVFADEALFVGDKKLADKLKGMVTSDTIEVEAKFMSRMTIANTLNWILASNHDHAITSDEGNRRACVLTLLPELAGNQNTIQRKATMEIINISPKDIARVLYADDIRNYDPTFAMPPCDGTTEQTRRSLSGTKAWLLDHYINNTQWIFVEDPPECPKMLPPRADALWADYVNSRQSGHGNNRVAFFAEMRQLTNARVVSHCIADDNKDIASGKVAANPRDPRNKAFQQCTQNALVGTQFVAMMPSPMPCIEGPNDTRVERYLITRSQVDLAWPGIIVLSTALEDTLLPIEKWEEMRAKYGASYAPPDDKPELDDNSGFGIPMPSDASFEIMLRRARPPRLIMPPPENSLVPAADSEQTFPPLPEMEIDDSDKGVKHSCVCRRVFVSEEVSITQISAADGNHETPTTPTTSKNRKREHQQNTTTTEGPDTATPLTASTLTIATGSAPTAGSKSDSSVRSGSSGVTDYMLDCYAKPMEFLIEEVRIALELANPDLALEAKQKFMDDMPHGWPKRTPGAVNITDLAAAVHVMLLDQNKQTDDVASEAADLIPTPVRIATAFGGYMRKQLKWKKKATKRHIGMLPDGNRETKNIVLYCQ